MVKKLMTVGYLALPIKSDQTTAFKNSEVVQTVAAATFKVNTLLRFHLELKTCVLSVFTLQAAAGFILSILQTTYLEKIRTATR